MATSYKKLYEEEKTRHDRLAAKYTRLQQQRDRERAKMDAFLVANRSKLIETPAVVDLAGIARHMRVARYTPQQWQQRGLLPPVDFPEIREPLWLASTLIREFAEPTGRLWYDEPGDEKDYDGDDVAPELSPAA